MSKDTTHRNARTVYFVKNCDACVTNDFAKYNKDVIQLVSNKMKVLSRLKKPQNHTQNIYSGFIKRCKTFCIGIQNVEGRSSFISYQKSKLANTNDFL